ncbi:hypothetical protein [Streptacidiphilus jiangxiensis]|uniref:Uncharacterized protein n=1 Tax=Streptacidiphilus jiangxiensis TaxID=235985 RepID=A0A1H7XAM4_STRJI|nr:hypothetical protein [Streptacidiphilus jiangxiensis]SEM30705.1 hypothetical protein SAMN05414137_12365 [Streptacidiphilus jiangxiensis]
MSVDPSRHLIGRWYTAAAVTSLTVPLTFVHAMRVTNWYVDHPEQIPGYDPADTSPGGDAMGYVLDLPLYLAASVICLLPTVLWLVAIHRARRGDGGPTATAAVSVLAGTCLLALPTALGLPHVWAGAGSVVVALGVALAAALLPWARRRLGGARSAPAQNRA